MLKKIKQVLLIAVSSRITTLGSAGVIKLGANIKFTGDSQLITEYQQYQRTNTSNQTH